MRSHRAGLVALVLGLGSAASAQPQVRDHRADHAMDGPREAPPAPIDEKFVPRRGHEWIAGHYEWKHGKWAWQKGHYEGRKHGKRFTAGHWENKGDHWEWTMGVWADAPKDQDPPPAEVVEVAQQRRGSVWVKGYWAWNDGAYDWMPGHLERRQRGKQWQDGRWDNSGGKWTWTAGAWIDAPKEPPAPPTPLDEKRQFRRGSVWVAGHWDWVDGGYEWTPGRVESRKKGKRWREGKWDNVGGKWTWNAGVWVDAPAEQDAPPPAIAEPEPQPRKGYVWIKGNHQWRDGDYEWIPGHWEHERAAKHWVDGHWDNVGGKWSWTAGAWQ